MENLQLILLFAVAISVVYVWVFRYHNVLKEFEQFGLGDTTRNLVGASKIVLATLLVVGFWHPSLIFIPSILMALFMLSAQYFHFKMKNPFIQKLPSLVLLIFCLALGLF
jgi:uncharacterized membrane protein YkgB